ncbi:hypothetical protein C0991_012600 [Blastosporella zonata]|nr:hypothetical protein C0991_012600 [Blastosporella zonata]
MKFLYALLCLATVSVHAKVTHTELAESKAKGLRLLSLESGADPIWKTEDERNELLRSDVEFVDPDPSHQAEINALIPKISISNLKQTVYSLSDFHDRSINTQGGSDAADWILNSVQEIIAKYPGSGATVKPFPHSWPQHSTIARIPGTTDGPLTIVSSHVDTINLDYDRFYDEAPGADDDASGCAELLETFRVLVESGFKPTTPIEFQWYVIVSYLDHVRDRTLIIHFVRVSGEEVGSLGSQEIAVSYKKAGVEVKGMMNIVLAG